MRPPAGLGAIGGSGAAGPAGAAGDSFGTLPTRVYLREEFPNASPTSGEIGQLGWQTIVSGAGASIAMESTSGDDNHGSVLKIASGTATTGRAQITNKDTGGSLGRFKPGTGRMRYNWIFQVPVLSTAGEEFNIKVGMTDSEEGGGGLPSAGFYVEYKRLTSDSFVMVTRSGGIETRTTLLATPDTNWHRVTADLNAAGTSLLMYLDGVLVGSPITTNIPTTTALEPNAAIYKSAGTTSRNLLVNAFEFQHDLTTPR